MSHIILDIIFISILILLCVVYLLGRTLRQRNKRKAARVALKLEGLQWINNIVELENVVEKYKKQDSNGKSRIAIFYTSIHILDHETK